MLYYVIINSGEYMINNKQRKELHQLLDQVINEKPSDIGEWEKISRQSKNDLDNLIYNIIDTRFNRDVDGDLPVHFMTIRRASESMLHLNPIPRKASLRRLRILNTVLNTVQNEVSRTLETLDND